MNNLTMIGRIVKDPEIRYSAGAQPVAFGSYTIAVDRPKRRDAENITDFIYCKVVGNPAEFAEKYLKKGMKIAIVGRVQVDNYKDLNGNNRSSTYVQVLQHEFCESKAKTEEQNTLTENNDFVNIPDGIDEELPFN